MSGFVVVSSTSLACIQAAELIWAEATGARDGDPYVPGAEPLQPVIADVINQSSAAMLLTALGPNKSPIAFAALDQTGGERAELLYFGVTPRAWGQGIATLLLGELPRALRSVGLSRAELWVYEDNRPAVRVYERVGWQPEGTVRTHPTSGKRELRYGLDLPGTGDHQKAAATNHTRRLHRRSQGAAPPPGPIVIARVETATDGSAAPRLPPKRATSAELS